MSGVPCYMFESFDSDTLLGGQPMCIYIYIHICTRLYYHHFPVACQTGTVTNPIIKRQNHPGLLSGR